MVLRFLIIFSLLFTASQHLHAAPAAADKMVVLQEAEVRQAVEKLLESKIAGRGWETRIIQLNLPPEIRISSKGLLDLEVIPPPRWDGWGQANLTLMVRVNGRLEKNLTIKVNVEALAPMVVATRQIQGGTVLSQSDLGIQKQDVGLSGGRYIASIEDAVGKKTRVSIRQNAPIKADQLDKVHLIKNGQSVTIVAESKALMISTTGRARGAGSVGDVIMVQNIGSFREIPATVVDASTVLVGF